MYLHVYDITREADRSNAKTVLTSFNGAGRWTGLGGVFHGGIQVLRLTTLFCCLAGNFYRGG